MEQPTFLDDYNKAVHDISLGQHLKRVIEKQKTQISNLKDWNLMDECLKIEEAYQLMLKFFSEGVKDEKRSEVYKLLQKRLLVLAQKIKRKRGIRESSELYYSKLRFVAHQSCTLQYYTNRLRAVYSQNLFLSITEALKGDDNARETYIEDLFDYIWVMPALTNEEYDELNNMFFNEQFVSDDEKLWLVSALTISTLSFYDERKLRMLVSLSDYKDMRVACRATVGLSLVVMYHRKLLKVSCPHQLLDFRPDLSATWAMLQVYYLTLSNTKRIRRQMEQNLMPLILDIQQNMTPEQLQNILEDEDADLPAGMDADTVRKIRASMLSMEDKASKGLDMYYSNFCKMKNGIFFHEVRNWFKPFSLNSFGENHIMNRIGLVAGDQMLCDSDKYSLAYMLSSLPQTLEKQFEELAGNMISANGGVDNAKDEVLRKRFDNLVASLGLSVYPNESLAYASQYLQDLYRFYMIKFSDMSEGNPFRTIKDSGRPTEALLIVVDNELIFHRMDQNDLAVVATEAYNQRLYKESVILFGLLKRKRILTSKERLVVAFCYAMLKEFDMAVEYFKSVEDEGIAFSSELMVLYSSCLVNSGGHTDTENLEHALEIYSNLYEENVKSFPICNYCRLLIRFGDYITAQEVLFKEDYLRPGQIRIERLLLECLLKTGKPEQALPFCEKMISDAKVELYDFMMIGHVYFALGDNAKALECYRKSCKEQSDGVFYFTKEEQALLQSLGVSALSVGLMIDSVMNNMSQI